MPHSSHPALGFGLGLRTTHYPHIFEHKPTVDWFEIISENFMDTDGKPKRNLARIKELYPIVMHGVALSIGTVDPINSEYLQKLKKLIAWVKPAWVSDHVCWTGVAHKNTHDLLPVPYTEEALKHLVQRIKEVQDFLERPIALENPSTYLEFNHSSMPEAEFIARMAEEADCHLLLDVNNVYVTCYNHRLDAKAYLDALPLDRVIQIHLSGHSNKGSHIIDTHDDYVIDEVWNLYKYVVHTSGRVPNTMIEWDDYIPELLVLLAELEKAKDAAKAAESYSLPDLYQEGAPQRCNLAPSLAGTQMHLQAAIMQGIMQDGDPAQWIRAKDDFAPEAQLAVYVNAYRYRLYDVVAEDYPVLKTYLGKEGFHHLLWAFVNKAQPSHFNIGRFALKLPEFVASDLPKDVFAYELCLLETTIAQMTDPEETAPLDQKHLEGISPEGLMAMALYPRKALALLSFSYPVNDYYRSVLEESAPKKPRRRASYVAIFRHEDIVWRMDLEKNEYQLLRELFDGKKVGDALEVVQNVAADTLSHWFSRWMRNGLLAAPEYQDTITLKGASHVVA